MSCKFIQIVSANGKQRILSARIIWRLQWRDLTVTPASLQTTAINWLTLIHVIHYASSTPKCSYREIEGHKEGVKRTGKERGLEGTLKRQLDIECVTVCCCCVRHIRTYFQIQGIETGKKPSAKQRLEGRGEGPNGPQGGLKRSERWKIVDNLVDLWNGKVGFWKPQQGQMGKGLN